MATQENRTDEDTKKSLDDGGFDFLGRELEDDARIWSVYRGEVTADDKAHGFEGWLQTLDVLLIFAGLFSAVVTAFLIDSYKLLQKPATDDFVAAALYALVVAANNSALLLDLPKPRPLSSDPSSLERWVNALWFTSLVIALAVALLALLAKQWIQEFHRRLSDRDAAGATLTPSNEWTRKRWFYLQGMTQKWPTDAFITYLLPLMLHIALFLFLAGLSLFLWSVDNVVSLVVLALSASLVTFYALCTLLPLGFPDAPTSTPFLNQLLTLVRTVPILLLRISIALCKYLERLDRPDSSPSVHPPAGSLPTSAGPPPAAADPLPLPVQAPLVARSRVQAQRTRLQGTLTRFLNRKDPSIERPESADERERRIADMLAWLINTGPSEHAVMFAFQAVGAVPLTSPYIPRLQAAAVGMSALTQFKSGVAPTGLEAIRAVRSELILGRGVWRSETLVLHVPETILHALKNLPNNSDAILFIAAIRGSLLSDIDDVLDRSDTVRFARFLLRCPGPMHSSVLYCLLAVLDFAALDQGDYDRIFELFASRDKKCICTTPSLLCLLPLMANTWGFHYASLVAFIASRILRYYARSGNPSPGLLHRNYRYDNEGELLSFLNHPGWLHPRVWDVSETNTNVLALSDIFPIELYMGSGNLTANASISVLRIMLHSFYDDSYFRWSGRELPLPALPPLTPQDFDKMLSVDWDEFSDKEVAKLILVKSIRFFEGVARVETSAKRPYHCTDALLAIAVRLCWLKRRWTDTDIADEVDQVMGIIGRCSEFWDASDWSNPTVTHLAQHFRELVPSHVQELMNSGRELTAGDEWLPFLKLVARVTPCTRSECPGTTQPGLGPGTGSTSEDATASHHSGPKDDAESSAASGGILAAPSPACGALDEEYMAAAEEAALWV